MKKFTFLILISLFTSLEIFSQAVLYLGAPPNTTSAFTRVPNGLAANGYVRSAHLIMQNELTVIPTSTAGTATLTAMGFSITTSASSTYSGNINVYLQNSTNASYSLGNNWSSILSGMTLVYSGPITFSALASSADFTLTTPFTYTNTQNLYVAYDFTLTSAPVSVAGVFAANNGIPSSGVTANTVATVYTGAPVNNSPTNTLVPTGQFSHKYVRSASHITSTELSGIPTSGGTATVTSLGFNTTANSSANITGNIDLYMLNTTDPSYTLGTTWSSIVAPMTLVYSGPVSWTNTAGTRDIVLTTPYTYTNTQNLYVAFSFTQTGIFSGTGAFYGANNTTTASCASMNNSASSPLTVNIGDIRPYYRFGTSSTVPPPSTLTVNSIRPHFRFGLDNPYTNDMSVLNIFAPGKVPVTFGHEQKILAVVHNGSKDTLKNIQVNCNITGFNTYADSYTIAALPGGVNDTIKFPNTFIPSAQGNNTITISVPSDQNNSNNQKTKPVEANCATYGVGNSPFSFSGLSCGFNTNSGLILNKIRTSVVNATIAAVNIGIGNDANNNGNTVYAVACDSLGTILSTSNPVTLNPSLYNTVKTFTLTSPPVMQATKAYWVGLAQPSNTVQGYFPLGTQVSAWLPKQIYATSILAGGFISIMPNNLGILAIEAVYTTTCISTLPVVENAAAQVMELSVYPNPAKTFVNLALSNVSDNAYAEFYNTIGQKVLVKTNLSEQNQIETATLPEGIYIVKVINGKQVATSKLIIER